MRKSGSGNGVNFNYPSSPVFVNNTIARPADLTASGNALGLLGGSGVSTITNCALYGFTNSSVDNTHFAGSNNSSNVAIGFGTSNQASKTYANQFQNTSDATRDFREKAGADLFNTGVTDTTNAPIDIAGTSRPQSTAYDIGCWELIVASTAVKHKVIGGLMLWPAWWRYRRVQSIRSLIREISCLSIRAPIIRRGFHHAH
jgi:hypothetical protein